MPAGANHAGRTRAKRTTLTAPVTRDELARIDAHARAAGLSRAEYVRRACLEKSMLPSG